MGHDVRSPQGTQTSGTQTSGPRCIALVGPFQSGKTTLLEAILARSGAIRTAGSVDAGTSVGDASPEARHHKMGVGLSAATISFMGDSYTFLDSPGSIEFAHDMRAALPAVTPAQVNAAWRRWIHPDDVEIVVVTPDAAALKKAILSNDPAPIHYPPDASGKPREVPAAVRDADAIIATSPLGARGDADVRIVKVEELFQ